MIAGETAHIISALAIAIASFVLGIFPAQLANAIGGTDHGTETAAAVDIHHAIGTVNAISVLVAEAGVASRSPSQFVALVQKLAANVRSLARVEHLVARLPRYTRQFRVQRVAIIPY